MKESILLLFGMVLVLAETIHSKSISDGGNDDDGGLRSADALKLQDETKAIKAHDDNLECLLQLIEIFSHIYEDYEFENSIENEYGDDDDDDDDSALDRITRKFGRGGRSGGRSGGRGSGSKKKKESNKMFW